MGAGQIVALHIIIQPLPGLAPLFILPGVALRAINSQAHLPAGRQVRALSELLPICSEAGAQTCLPLAGHCYRVTLLRSQSCKAYLVVKRY